MIAIAQILGNDGDVKNVSLREVEESDLPVFFDNQIDPEAHRMAAVAPRDREAFMEHWAKVLRNPTATTRTILFGDEVAGNIGIWEHEGVHNVGYFVGKKYWGKGIASAALGQMLALVTARPLIAHVVKHNVGSLRVLQKNGFAISGQDSFSVREGEEGEEYVLTLEALPAGSARTPGEK